jgi:hypothetical protein
MDMSHIATEEVVADPHQQMVANALDNHILDGRTKPQKSAISPLAAERLFDGYWFLAWKQRKSWALYASVA